MTPPNDKELLGPILEECTKIENPLAGSPKAPSFMIPINKMPPCGGWK